MKLITLDFETYFADDYTLSKMTTEEYVRDPRFKAHLVGLKEGEDPAYWITPEVLAYDVELRTRLRQNALLVQG